MNCEDERNMHICIYLHLLVVSITFYRVKPIVGIQLTLCISRFFFRGVVSVVCVYFFRICSL